MQVANLEKWHPAQHVVTESLSGAIVTQKIVCHGPSHPKLPQPSPGKHTGVAEFIFNGEQALTAGAHPTASAICGMHDAAALVWMLLLMQASDVVHIDCHVPSQ